MKYKNRLKTVRYLILILGLITVGLISCEKDVSKIEETRLFRPVLNGTGLSVENNVITINIGKLKDAVSYTVEVSRDTFQVVDYAVTVDTNYIVLDKELLDEELLYNTLYQIRITAHAKDKNFDSRPADVGSIRTQRFPSILNLPRSFDVTDVEARVTWEQLGAAVTEVKVFSANDLRLVDPLMEFTVSPTDQDAGETVILGLEPDTRYQIAIYSKDVLRGWVDYKTLVAGIDITDPNVVDLSKTDDPTAIISALDLVPEGGIILLKKGVRYNMPTTALNKSVTFKGAYGLIEERAALVNTSGNMNIASGANIQNITFDDLEIDGGNISATYVFNPSIGVETQVQELVFENCELHDMRGIIRIRESVFIRNYTISNSTVHHIGGYSVLTADTDGDGKAAFDNVKFVNSTFYKINSLIQTRQNFQSLKIDGCTFSEFTSGGAQVFRFRGAAGYNDVINGIEVQNSIFGSGWDETGSQNVSITMKSGLPNTSYTISNTWGTTDLDVRAGTEIPGLPDLFYNNTSDKLWGDPDNGVFNILDPSFSGKYDSGAPKWRTKL